MKNWAFYKQLHARGVTVSALARAIGSSRAHVTEVLNNMPGHGYRTRPKLRLLLTAGELEALGWEGEKAPSANIQHPENNQTPMGMAVPRGTKFQ